MEQSLADIDDGEELIDTKLGGVHFTDNRLQPSQLCLQLLDISTDFVTITLASTEEFSVANWSGY